MQQGAHLLTGRLGLGACAAFGSARRGGLSCPYCRVEAGGSSRVATVVSVSVTSCCAAATRRRAAANCRRERPWPSEKTAALTTSQICAQEQDEQSCK